MDNALHTAEILLPGPLVDPKGWAVVACDQFTAQPEYWHQAEALVGDAPSALRLILPEAWLPECDARIPAIHGTMARYLEEGLLVLAVKDGFVLTERTTPTGVRPGLVAALDLEAYDFRPGSRSLIRPTEGTHPCRRAGGTAPCDDADRRPGGYGDRAALRPARRPAPAVRF